MTVRPRRRPIYGYTCLPRAAKGAIGQKKGLQRQCQSMNKSPVTVKGYVAAVPRSVDERQARVAVVQDDVEYRVMPRGAGMDLADEVSVPVEAPVWWKRWMACSTSLCAVTRFWKTIPGLRNSALPVDGPEPPRRLWESCLEVAAFSSRCFFPCSRTNTGGTPRGVPLLSCSPQFRREPARTQGRSAENSLWFIRNGNYCPLSQERKMLL